MAERSWVCQRQTNKVKCGFRNPKRKQICSKCGKHRPASKKPTHMQALDLPYEMYAEINGGEFCGICLRKPPAVKLCRDHEHKGNGKPRGLLCIDCNRRLTHRYTIEWLEGAIAYLNRSQD